MSDVPRPIQNMQFLKNLIETAPGNWAAEKLLREMVVGFASHPEAPVELIVSMAKVVLSHRCDELIDQSQTQESP